MRVPQAVGITALLLATGSLAEAPRGTTVSSVTAACDAARSAHAATLSCLGATYADLDRQLAEAYRNAVGRIETSGLGRNLIMDWKRALQEAQRKWIAYREADCGPPIAYERAGTSEAAAVAQVRCKIEHASLRLDALQSRYGRMARE